MPEQNLRRHVGERAQQHSGVEELDRLRRDVAAPNLHAAREAEVEDLGGARWLMTMLALFRSRWMTPRPCACASASAICVP